MEHPSPIRVVVADPLPVLRHGLTRILLEFAGIEVAGMAATSAEIVSRCQDLRPDVLLTDWWTDDLDPFATLETMTTMDPNLRVILFTLADGEDDVCGAIRAGAQGYVSKHAEPDELCVAIGATMAGRRYLTPTLAPRLAKLSRIDPLSTRERQILGLLATGMPNKRIAHAASITEGTVKFHVNRILSKLDCRTRTEAVACGLRRGLVQLR